MIALGVWRDAEDKIDKRTNALLEELIRCTPKPVEQQPEQYTIPPVVEDVYKRPQIRR